MGWARGQIVKVLDEMIYVKPEDLSEKYADWIEVESQNIAKEGTHVKEKNLIKDSNSSDDSPHKMDSDENDQ